MSKKLIYSLLIICLIMFGVSCSKETNDTVEESPDLVVLTYLNELDNNATIDNINELTEIEGEFVSNGTGYETYIWHITETASITATFYTFTSNCDISIDLPNDLLKNANVDFSHYEEISSSLKNGENVTYEDLQEKFGTEGTLIEKGTSNSKYKWVNANGGYLIATISNVTNKCTMIVGEY